MAADRTDGEQQGRRDSQPDERRDSRSASAHDSSSRSPEYEKRPRSEQGHAAFPSEPPLPYDEEPPLPDEAPPQDDGWEALFDHGANAFYFYNRFTHVKQWENPRVPEATATSYASYDRSSVNATSGAPGTSSSSGAPGTSSPPRRRAGRYNPAIHGSYDPNADYAIEARKQEEEEEAAALAAAAVAAGLPDPNKGYGATGHFNRFTGRFQAASINPENHSDEAKSRRQMNAFFDVDAAANSHDGRSLKAERRAKPISKKQLQEFKNKRRERKEEKRRAWLRD